MHSQGRGRRSSGDTVVPAGLTNVAAIAAGGFHSLALKEDGTLALWGTISEGVSTILRR